MGSTKTECIEDTQISVRMNSDDVVFVGETHPNDFEPEFKPDPVDLIREMMGTIDAHSDRIPEGFYLEVCGQIKDLFKACKGVGNPDQRPCCEHCDAPGHDIEDCDVLYRENEFDQKETEFNRKVTEFNTAHIARTKKYNDMVRSYNTNVSNFNVAKTGVVPEFASQPTW